MRRGLSYLEVLIAAGIALVGLMGAVAVLPVASLNMQRGITSDVTAALGPSAMEQAQAMGLNKPSLWVDPGTMQPVEKTPQTGDTQHSSRTDIGGRYWLNGVQANESFCIDPRYCAELTTYDSAIHDPYKFPYVKQSPGHDVRMRRITLGNGSGGMMSTNQARLLFKLNDDLIFTKPDDLTAPAKIEPLKGKFETPVRRDYMGDYEWIATFTPQVVLQDASSFQMTGNYQMSVVVFHQRNPRLDTITDTAGTTNADDERLVDVEFLSNGYNGGDVTIQARAGRPVSDLNMQVGQWVMLSAMTFTKPGATAATQGSFAAMAPMFRWYKIVGFSEVYSGNRRDVSLEGEDWPVESGKNLVAIPSLSSGVVTTRMTICSDVVGVYSTLVRLD